LLKTDLTGDMDERLIEQIAQNLPLKRLLRLDEVAAEVLKLLDPTIAKNGENLLLNA